MSDKTKKIRKITKGLSKEQKRIIGIGIIIFVCILLFWHFIYVPQRQKQVAIQKDLSKVENQIDEVRRLTRGEDLAIAVKELKLNFLNNIRMLPSQDEAVISYLLAGAKKFRVKVKNIIPSSKKLIDSSIPGYDIEELPISLSLVAEYKNLGEYLSFLREDSQVLIKIDSLDIHGNGEGRIDLNANLGVCAYLAQEE